jgi:hypothetical protein
MRPGSVAQPLPPDPRERHCTCCGSPIASHEKRVFCADCLERGAAYNDNDPYDEIGEGE